MKDLKKNNVENILHLVPVQEGMLFHYLMNPLAQTYHTQLAIELKGKIDLTSFSTTWNKIVEKHAMLRTVFRWENLSQPIQIVLKKNLLPIRFYDLTSMTEENRELEYRHLLENDRIEVFSLDEVPFRITLCTMDEDRHYMLITHHHILYDGWSTYIILRDFFEFYGKNLDVLVQPKNERYSEYVKEIMGKDKEKEKRYWSEYLGGAEEVNPWFITSSNQVPIFEEKRFTMNESLTEKIKSVLQQKNLLLSSFIYFVYAVLLRKYQDTDEVIYGYTLSTRGLEGKAYEDTIGNFINTLPLRVQYKDQQTIVDAIRDITCMLDEQRKFATTPLVDIKKYCESSKKELFDSILVIENYPSDTRRMNNEQIKMNSFSSWECSNYGLTIGIELFDTIDLTISYNKMEMDSVIMERFGEDFFFLLEEVIDHIDGTCDTIDLLRSEEAHRILEEFNHEVQEPVSELPLYRQFEQMVERYPNNIAVRTKEEQVDYKALNNISNSIANSLVDSGIQRNQKIVMLLSNSIPAIATMIAVQKIGCSYVPIDILTPEERIRYILKDCQAVAVVTETDLVDFVSGFYDGIVIDISKTDRNKESSIQEIPYENNCCYIIYTSGTTGNPKGVMVSHSNVAAYVHSFSNKFSVTEKDIVLQQASMAFDTSVEEIYPALVHGGQIVIFDHSKALDIVELKQFIETYSITIVSCSPLLLNELNQIEPPTNVRLWISGGDVLKTEYIDHFPKQCSIYNTYGPTEGTVCASYYKCTSQTETESRIPIGKPIDTAQIYIVDRREHIVPIGVPGELCIAGSGVTMGYLNLPELTKEKYKEIIEGKTVYKTGDLARWLPSGDIDYLGRIDQQVNIRGYRIELGEIESVIRKIKGVKDAVVITSDSDDSRKYLMAFYMASERLTSDQIKKEIAQYLPAYMIPSMLTQVEEIPHTLNGKIDVKKLQRNQAQGTVSSVKKEAKENTYETKILEIWTEVLQHNKIKLDDNFFDVGGNSILLIQLNNKLNQAFAKDIKIGDLFQYTTIRKQAQLISGVDETTKEDIATPLEPSSHQDIAVIGVSARFPGAVNVEEVWENLIHGVESIKDLTQEELDKADVSRKLQEDPNYVKRQGVMEGIDQFDAAFFGYKPNEAMVMDPQVRVFHEVVWEALEDAGYDPIQYKKPIGIFAGASPNLYWESNSLHSDIAKRIGIFTSELYANKDYMSQLIAYKLGFTGPAISIYSACSTSLISVIMAAQSLIRGESSMAVAGSVTIVPLPDKSGYLYEDGLIMSQDGHCKTFDDNATGFVPGKGSAVAVLKRLDDAIRDHDHIYSVIKGFAMNNDGNRKVGYNAPSTEGITDVMKEALKVSNVSAESIRYMETHGAATKLGDLIEIQAAQKAFATKEKNYCAIGSIKSNIGHLDCTSGIAGFVKALLIVKNRMIPPSLNYSIPNKDLDLIDSPFYVETECEKIEELDQSLYVGVNSIGQGGTNAHVILGEAPHREITESKRKSFLFLFSARSEEALKKMMERYVTYFEKNVEMRPEDIAYTLQVGRRHFKYRAYVYASNHSEIMQQCELADKNIISMAENREIYFVFSGRNSAFLIENYRELNEDILIRKEVEKNLKFAQKIFALDVMKIHEDLRVGKNPVIEDKLSQLLSFVYQYSYAKVLMSFGIEPKGVKGEGCYEAIALCITGALSLEEALQRLKNDSCDAKEYEESILDEQAWVEQLQQSESAWVGVIDFGKVSAVDSKITYLNPITIGVQHMNNILGTLWSVGYTIDWELYNSMDQVNRVSLPTYYFENQSYWIESEVVREDSSTSMNTRNDLSDWFYSPIWKQSHLISKSRTDQNQVVLILAEETSFITGLIDYFKQTGYKVLCACPGESFMRKNDSWYTIHFGDREQYKLLIGDILKSYNTIHSIINCFGLEEGQGSIENHDDLITKFFLLIVYLSDAIQECNVTNQIKLMNLVTGLNQILGDEVRHPEKSLMIGASMVASQEINNLAFQCLELDHSCIENRKNCYPRIEKELRSVVQKPITAFRNHVRWELDYEPVHLVSSEEQNLGFHQGGVYLIIGGLGGVGYHLCSHLLKKYNAKVFITGRSDVIGALETTQLDQAMSRKVDKYNKLKTYPGECYYLCANAHKYEEMQKVFEVIEEKAGCVDGIIYSATTSDDSLFHSVHEVTAEDIKLQFNAKIVGIQVLAEVLKSHKAGFCLAMSSIASVVGGLGFSAYSSANIFLDYFVNSQDNSNTRWISVNWEGWDIDNKETRFDYTNASIMDYFMSVDEGIEAMERILNLDGIPQVAVSTVSLFGRLNQWVYKNNGNLDQVKVEKTLNLQELSIQEIEEAIIAILKVYFGFSEINKQATFFELGASSLDLIQICLNIRKKFEISLTIVELFKYPSVNLLAEHLYSQHDTKTQEKIERVKEEEKREEKIKFDKIKERKQLRLQKRKE